MCGHGTTVEAALELDDRGYALAIYWGGALISNEAFDDLHADEVIEVAESRRQQLESFGYVEA